MNKMVLIPFVQPKNSLVRRKKEHKHHVSKKKVNYGIYKQDNTEKINLILLRASPLSTEFNANMSRC